MKNFVTALMILSSSVETLANETINHQRVHLYAAPTIQATEPSDFIVADEATPSVHVGKKPWLKKRSNDNKLGEVLPIAKTKRTNCKKPASVSTTDAHDQNKEDDHMEDEVSSSSTSRTPAKSRSRSFTAGTSNKDHPEASRSSTVERMSITASWLPSTRWPISTSTLQHSDKSSDTETSATTPTAHPSRPIPTPPTTTNADILTWHSSCSATTYRPSHTVGARPPRPITQVAGCDKHVDPSGDRSSTPLSHANSQEFNVGHETNVGHEQVDATATGDPAKSGTNFAWAKVQDPKVAQFVYVLWLLVALEVVMGLVNFMENIWGQVEVFELMI